MIYDTSLGYHTVYNSQSTIDKKSSRDKQVNEAKHNFFKRRCVRNGIEPRGAQQSVAPSSGSSTRQAINTKLHTN